jgi:hypothetical protein
MGDDIENKVINVTASELEEQIFDKEGVRVVIRAGKDTKFPPYNYKNKASASMSKTSWYMSRVKPLLGEFEGEVVDGHGEMPHGRTQMIKMRDSYQKD